jgi:hypothetical protein
MREIFMLSENILKLFLLDRLDCQDEDEFFQGLSRMVTRSMLPEKVRRSVRKGVGGSVGEGVGGSGTSWNG